MFTSLLKLMQIVCEMQALDSLYSVTPLLIRLRYLNGVLLHYHHDTVKMSQYNPDCQIKSMPKHGVCSTMPLMGTHSFQYENKSVVPTTLNQTQTQLKGLW